MESPLDQSPGPDALVVCHRARTPMEAEVLAALLRGHGIAVLVEGGQLTDEFAVSQRWLNLQGVTLRVHPDRLAEVQRILADRGTVDPEELERQALESEGEAGEGGDTDTH